MNDDQSGATSPPIAPALDAATLARIRAEESARPQVREALTRRTPRSGFDKLVALSNTISASARPGQLALARALPERVYIQIADASQEPIANSLRAAYEKRGWIVPLTETVGKNAPSGLQVRYFNDIDSESASRTLGLIDAIPEAKALPHAIPPVRRLDLKAPPGQIEVWLPKAG